MFSYGLPHMAEQKQGDQLEPTYSNSVMIRDIAHITNYNWSRYNICDWITSYYYKFLPDIRIMVRVFTRETWVQSQVESYQRGQKIVLDAFLLNTQHYKVRIKDKVGQFWEMSSPPTPWRSSYRKGSLRVTLDYGCQQLLSFLIS